MPYTMVRKVSSESLNECMPYRPYLPKGCADFYDAPAAWLNADWIGPARGFIDPVKEAQASSLRIDGRISTLEREAAEQGQDWEEIIAQLARERATMEAAGIPGVVTDTKIVAPTDAQQQPGGEQGRQGDPGDT